MWFFCTLVLLVVSAVVSSSADWCSVVFFRLFFSISFRFHFGFLSMKIQDWICIAHTKRFLFALIIARIMRAVHEFDMQKSHLLEEVNFAKRSDVLSRLYFTVCLCVYLCCSNEAQITTSQNSAVSYKHMASISIQQWNAFLHYKLCEGKTIIVEFNRRLRCHELLYIFVLISEKKCRSVESKRGSK